MDTKIHVQVNDSLVIIQQQITPSMSLVTAIPFDHWNQINEEVRKQEKDLERLNRIRRNGML